jgi:hypothetical protein
MFNSFTLLSYERKTMPLTEPAVQFSSNGLFISIHFNNHRGCKDYGVSSVSVRDISAGIC